MIEPRSITCPSCGGEVTVTTEAARVASCPYCASTLIVNEAAIRALGKMALLAETPSCLAVGWRAECLGREIRVLGRIQYRYRSGLWDEWWVQFVDDQSYAWISQDEDEYMLERPLDKLRAPDYDSISPGDKFQIADHKLWVEEKDQAVMAGMQGELPLDATPDGVMRYIDLTDNELKLTIEYFEDNSYMAFQGRYLKRQDLRALDEEDYDDGSWESPYAKPALAAPPSRKPPVAAGEAAEDPTATEVVATSAGVRPQTLACPNCGGTVELRDSAGTAMVVCQFCDVALDVTVPGKVQQLYQSEQRRLPFPIPLGAKGRFKGVEWTAVGRVRYREDDPSGIWQWDEVQLYNPERGYCFLALEDGHWMLFERLAHRVSFDPRTAQPKQNFSLQGQRFKVFERSAALITYVEGELSWVARLGDRVGYMDAIRPPQMVSAEWTETELEWSIGRYLPGGAVAAAFDLDSLPQPVGVAPAQPFQRTADQHVRAWSGLAVAAGLLLLCLFTFVLGEREKIFDSGSISSKEYLSDAGYVSNPFEVPEGSHICQFITEGRGLNNSWVALSVAFLDENENVLLDAEADVEYFHGTEGGESWSEGSTRSASLLRLTGPKAYHLNVFGQAGVWSAVSGDSTTGSGAPIDIEIVRGVLPTRYFLIAALLAAIYPAWEFGRQMLFSSRRWPSDDDDDD